MEKISVIVPVFKGEKYMRHLVEQMERCTTYLSDKRIELILANDDPNTPIFLDNVSALIDIIILNTNKNRGIHGARVWGLEHSYGEYILFLDQDDEIAPEYFKSQLQCIHGKDASVCRALSENKPFYDSNRLFEKVINFETMFSRGNSICSPGQVLIRKKAIPTFWKENILKNNGADDWFLWICMLKEKKSFGLNNQIQYQHVLNGLNESLNVLSMKKSETEIFQTLKKEKYLNIQELTVFEKTLSIVEEIRINNLIKFRKMFHIYDTWMRLRRNSFYISVYLKKKGCQKIAIYGAGYLGKQLREELINDKMVVRCFIDQNALYFNKIQQLEVCSLENIPLDIDSIIITLTIKSKKIVRQLNRNCKAKIYFLTDIINEMEWISQKF